MSEHAIKILIVDDNEKTRDKLIEQLRFEDVTVVGESTFGAAAYTWAQQLDVDLVVVAIEEPIARSLRTIESLAVGSETWPVLGLSSMTDRETMRKAILAGVRDYLVTPVSDAELHKTIVTIHRVEQQRRAALAKGQTAGRVGNIVAVVGVKGGIGKSTVASNIAVSLAEQTKQQIALADLDLQFGDDAVMLDVMPARTIEDAARELTGTDPQLIQGYLTNHASRVRLLAAPATPEGGETISEDQAGTLLEMLAATHDYVIVDTPAHFEPISMRAMDLATMVLVVVVPEVPCVRRTRAALALMKEWGYSRDKVKLIVNRTRKKQEVSLKEIEEVLHYPVYAVIPEDAAAVKGISTGTPVALSAPKSEAGRAFADLGRTLVGLPKAGKRRGLLRRKTQDPIPTGPDRTPPLTPRPATETPAPRVASEEPTRATRRTGEATGIFTLSSAERVPAESNGHSDEQLVEMPRAFPFRGRAGD